MDIHTSQVEIKVWEQLEPTRDLNIMPRRPPRSRTSTNWPREARSKIQNGDLLVGRSIKQDLQPEDLFCLVTCFILSVFSSLPAPPLIKRPISSTALAAFGSRPPDSFWPLWSPLDNQPFVGSLSWFYKLLGTVFPEPNFYSIFVFLNTIVRTYHQKPEVVYF